MNRDKFVHNPDYREGYECGLKEGKNQIRTKTFLLLDYIKGLIETFEKEILENDTNESM